MRNFIKSLACGISVGVFCYLLAIGAEASKPLLVCLYKWFNHLPDVIKVSAGIGLGAFLIIWRALWYDDQPDESKIGRNSIMLDMLEWW